MHPAVEATQTVSGERVMSILVQALVEGLCEGAQMATLGVAFALYYQVVRAFDFSIALPYLAAGYAFVLARAQLGLAGGGAGGVALVAAVLTAFLVVGSSGRLYRARGLDPLSVMVASIGVYTSVVAAVGLAVGNGRVHPPLQVGAPMFHLAAVPVLPSQVLRFVLPAAACLSIIGLVRFTGLGRHLRAIASNRGLALAMGMRVEWAELVVLLLVGLAQFSVAVPVSNDLGVSPGAGMRPFLYGEIAMLVGGAATLGGPVLAGFGLGLGLHLAMVFVPAHYKEILVFVPLVIALILRPDGLVSLARRAEEDTA